MIHENDETAQVMAEIQIELALWRRSQGEALGEAIAAGLEAASLAASIDADSAVTAALRATLLTLRAQGEATPLQRVEVAREALAEFQQAFESNTFLENEYGHWHDVARDLLEPRE